MKTYSVSYTRDAIVDINEAVDYYEVKSSGLGMRFAECVLEKTAEIAQNPFHARIRYDQIHCSKVPDFPYLIHYSVDDGLAQVIIEAVWNTWRHPLWERHSDES